jgi:hypothetical protein
MFEGNYVEVVTDVPVSATVVVNVDQSVPSQPIGQPVSMRSSASKRRRTLY